MTGGNTRKFGMLPAVTDQEIDAYKANIRKNNERITIDFTREEALYQRFIKFYASFTKDFADENINRKGLVKYEYIAGKAKDYYILLKPSIDYKKLQNEVKAK